MAVGSAATGSVALVSTTSGASWVQAGALPAAMSGASAISCTGDQRCWVTGHTDGGSRPRRRGPRPHHRRRIELGDGGHAAGHRLAQRHLVPQRIDDRQRRPPGPVDDIDARPADNGHGRERRLPARPPRPPPVRPRRPRPPPAPPSTTTTAPIVGVPGARCTVVGTTADILDVARAGHGLIFTTANGGATWSSQTVTSLSASLNGVSCTAIGTCVTVGSSVATSPQAGLVIVTGVARPSVEGAVDGGRTATADLGELHLTLPLRRRR